jgi:hypothetical protein
MKHRLLHDVHSPQKLLFGKDAVARIKEDS